MDVRQAGFIGLLGEAVLQTVLLIENLRYRAADLRRRRVQVAPARDGPQERGLRALDLDERQIARVALGQQEVGDLFASAANRRAADIGLILDQEDRVGKGEAVRKLLIAGNSKLQVDVRTWNKFGEIISSLYYKDSRVSAKVEAGEESLNRRLDVEIVKYCRD